MRNEWGVSFNVTDEQIASDLERWTWGDDRRPVAVAKVLLRMVAEQTMADIEADGTVVMGLFEHEMPLTVPLAALVQDWIEAREDRDTRKLSGEHALDAAGLAALLERLAAKLRGRIAEFT
jgi:hypothetical protein